MIIKNRLFLISGWFVALMLFLLSVITIVLLIWSSNKGLDVTDEGIYLMATQFPEEVKIAPSVFYFYTAGLYIIAGHNLIALRIIGLLLMIGSAALLFWGLYYLLKSLGLKLLSDSSVLISAWSVVTLGALLHYAWWLLTPGYNFVNAVAINTASGFLFFGLALLERKDRKCLSNAAFCGAGLCIGISLLVKASTGMSLLIVISGILLLWPCTSFLNKIKNIVFVGVGVIVWLLIHFGIIQSPVSWWQNFQRGVENALILNPAYGLINIKRYFLEYTDVLKNDFLAFWKFYLSVIVGGGVLVALRKLDKNWHYLFPVLLLILLAATGWKSYCVSFPAGIRHIYTSNIMIVYMAWILILAFAIIVTMIYYQKSFTLRSAKQYQLILTSIVLLSLPFAGVVGTGNSIYTGFFLYLAPWFALLIILLIILSILHDSQLIFNCGTVVISLLACIQITCGALMVPYRLNTPMMGQTIYTNIGWPSTRLMLDPAASDFFNRIQEAARTYGFKPGDDVLAFSDLAGVVFALGGKSPYITHYTSGYQGSHAVNEKTLSLIPKERIKKAFILQNVSGKSWRGRVEKGTDGFPDLTKYGIDFPGDYVLCGEAVGTYYDDLIRLWKPK